MDAYKDLALAERAAAWIAAMEREGDEQRAAFSAWLKESPRHIEEALFAAAVAEELRGFDRDKRVDVKAILREHSINVLPLATPSSLLARVRARDSRWGSWAAGIALLAFGIASAWWWDALGPGSWQSYTTALGEQRTVELADSSLVHLNTQSRVDVRFRDEMRDVRLVQGEALFKVHHDPAQPFRVHTDHAVIQAIGTQFDVYQHSGETRVSVIEGRVRISTPQSAPQDSTAGQSASISSEGVIAPKPRLDAVSATAWRQRRLIFQADTLEHIAAEFNRYNRTPQVRIEGNAIRQMRFTGVFDADDPESLSLLLGRDPDLNLEKRAGELVISHR